MGNADAPATATGSRLDHHRKTDCQSDAAGLNGIVNPPVRAWNHRHTGRFRRDPSSHLVAHHPDRIALWADPDQSCGFNRIGKVSVLRQEPVARMHRIRAGVCGCFQDAGDIEIAFRRHRWPDIDRLIRHFHGQ